MTAAAKFAAKGQHDRAAKEYLTIIEADPNDLRSWLLLAEALANAGDKPGAIDRYIHVGKHYADTNEAQKAIAVYRKVLGIDANRLDIQSRIAALYKGLGRTADAVAAYEFVAQAYFQSGQIAEGLEGFRMVAELEPAAVGKRLRLAELYSREGMVAQAVEHFRLAAERLLADRRTDDYIRVAERLIYHKEDDLPVLRSLAQIYLKQGENRRALVKLNALLRAAPADAEGLELLGDTFVAIGKVDKAVSVVMELAREQRKGGRKAKETAARVLKKALAWTPENAEDIKKIVAEIEAEIAALPTEPKDAKDEDISLDVDVVEDEPDPDDGNLDLDVDVVEDEERKVEEVPSRPFAPVGANVAPHGAAEEREDNVGDVEKVLLEARVYVKYKMYEHALGHLDTVFVRDANNTAALELQAQILSEQGKASDAADSYVRLAQLVSSRDPRLAREHLARAQKLSPDHTKAEMVLAALESGGGQASVEANSLLRGLHVKLGNETATTPDPTVALDEAVARDVAAARDAANAPATVAPSKAKAKAEADAEVKVRAEKAEAEVKAQAKVDADRAEADAKAKAEADAKAAAEQAEADAKAAAEKVEAEAKEPVRSDMSEKSGEKPLAPVEAAVEARSPRPRSGAMASLEAITTPKPTTEDSSARRLPEMTTAREPTPLPIPLRFSEKTPLPRSPLATRFGEKTPLPTFKPPPARPTEEPEKPSEAPASAAAATATKPTPEAKPVAKSAKPTGKFGRPTPVTEPRKSEPASDVDEMEVLDADDAEELVEVDEVKPVRARPAPPSKRPPAPKRAPPARNDKQPTPEAKPTETSVSEAKPTETSVSEAKPTETSVSEAKPTETSVSEAKPTETSVSEKPTETSVSEAKPTEPAQPEPIDEAAKPVEDLAREPSEAKPVDGEKPAQPEPIDEAAKPVEDPAREPSEAKPVEDENPAEAKPIEADAEKPAEAKPVEDEKPAEAKPVEADADKPADAKPEPPSGDNGTMELDAALTEQPPPDYPDISDELEELRFFISGRFEDDAQFAYLELQRRYPGHPALRPFADSFSAEAKLASAAAPVSVDDAPASKPAPAAPSVAPAKAQLADDDGDDDFLASIFNEPAAPTLGKASQPRRAVATLDEAADAQTFFDLGTAYREMGLDDDALAQFELAAKDARWTSRARIMMASLRLQRGDSDRAVADLEIAIEHASDDDERSEARYELGVLFQTLGDKDRAISALKQVAPGYRDRDERLGELS